MTARCIIRLLPVKKICTRQKGGKSNTLEIRISKCLLRGKNQHGGGKIREQ